MQAVGEQTCRIYANLHYTIVYAEMGFSENLQRYIVKVEKSSRQQLWKFNRKLPTEKQRFPAYVSFQYVKLEQTDIDGEDMTAKRNWWDLHEDLLYPFSSKSSATTLQSMAAALATALVLLNVAI